MLRFEPATFDSRRFTDAPLRIEGRLTFDVPASTVFRKIADHKGLLDWVPMLKSVEVDHSQSEATGCSGVGSKRHCSAVGMELDEKIVHWDEPSGYAYSIAGEGVPTKDHVGVFFVEPRGANRSVLTWQQYFEPVGLKGKVFPTMMKMMMKMGMKNLRKEFGGDAVSVEKIAA